GDGQADEQRDGGAPPCRTRRTSLIRELVAEQVVDEYLVDGRRLDRGRIEDGAGIEALDRTAAGAVEGPNPTVDRALQQAAGHPARRARIGPVVDPCVGHSASLAPQPV